MASTRTLVTPKSHRFPAIFAFSARKRIDPEEVFRTTHDAEAYQGLVKLRAQISGILEKRGIAVLPAQEWRKAAPWLRGGEDTLPGIESRAIRVLDAFFFEEL